MTFKTVTQAGGVIFVLGLLAGAKNGCGSEDANDTLKSPVQAVTTVLEQADGTVEARLVLVSTAANPHAFVDSATDVSLRTPDGDRVTLAPTAAGHYTASSKSDAELVYEGGARYQFTFALDDKDAAGGVAGGDFVAAVTAPDDTVSFTLQPPEFAGDTAKIDWTPVSRYGLITIKDASGATVWTNFDFSDPAFDGSKWAKLKRGSNYTLGTDAFREAGDYTVSFCAVDKVSDFDKELSAELGALSGFLAGRCAADQTLTVNE